MCIASIVEIFQLMKDMKYCRHVFNTVVDRLREDCGNYSDTSVVQIAQVCRQAQVNRLHFSKYRVLVCHVLQIQLFAMRDLYWRRLEKCVQERKSSNSN